MKKTGLWAKILLILIVFFCNWTVVSAEGTPLEQAKVLYEEKKYNDAILILTAYMKTITDKDKEWAEADAMIQDIRKKQTEYNDLYKNLIVVLYTDKDVKRALEIIAQLEALDSAPNSVALESVEKARKSAAFIYDQTRFEEIMAEAVTLLEAGKYKEASALYYSGFTLQARDFRLSNYSANLFSRADAAVKKITDSDSLFWTQYKTWEQNLIRLSADTAVVTNAVRTDWSEMQTLSGKLFALRQEVYDGSSELSKIDKEIQALSGQLNREELYIGFVTRLVKGRKASGLREGMVSAYDLALESVLKKTADSVMAEAARKIAQIEESFPKNDYTTINTLAGFPTFRMEQFSMLLEKKSSSTIPLEIADYPTDLSKPLPVYHKISVMLKQRQKYQEAATALTATLSKPTTTSIADYRSYRSLLAKTETEIKAIIDFFKAENSKMALISGTRYDLSEMTALLARSAELMEAQNLALNSTDTAYMQNVYSQWSKDLSAVFAPVTDRKKKADLALTGTPRINADGTKDEEKISRYPGTAKKEYLLLLDILAKLKTDINSFYVSENSEDAVQKKTSTVPASKNEVQNLQTQAGLLENDIRIKLAEAEQLLLNAEQALREAEYRYTQATDAAAAKEFTTARTRLQEAANKYNEYFDIEDDAALRASIDENIKALFAQIGDRENQLVIEETNKYLEDAKKQYDLSLFDNSEELLNLAANRWDDTHTDPNPAVEQWKKIVKNARLYSTGRTIAVTDPLYNDMMQLLDFALQNFEKAKKAYIAKNKADLDKYKNETVKNLSKIQSAFPLNQDASLLRLRLEFLTDLDAANKIFQSKYAEAVASIGSDPGKAYTDLKDLEAINPNFPNLAATILKLEYQLAIKIPPPNPADVAASNEKARQAKIIIDSRNSALYSQAEALLGEAINLYPQSQIANAYYSELAAIKGGTTVTLSTGDLDKFNRAQNYYLNAGYFQSRKLVNELLANANNRKYAPLQDLHNSLTARGYP